MYQAREQRRPRATYQRERRNQQRHHTRREHGSRQDRYQRGRLPARKLPQLRNKPRNEQWVIGVL